MRVLIIDDSNAVRPRLEHALAAIEGLDVSSCAPSEGGVMQRILEGKPDVVVIDVHMPGGALELIRAMKAGAHAPVVIALSPSSSIQYRSACHRAGAEFFFDKAREQERLVEAVADLQKELAS
jgi:DNA-binding NarL/FixJ family response regulator